MAGLAVRLCETRSGNRSSEYESDVSNRHLRFLVPIAEWNHEAGLRELSSWDQERRQPKYGH